MREARAQGHAVRALGVDVATRAGWSVVQADGGHESVIETGIVSPGDPPVCQQIEHVVSRAFRQGVELAVLERPYLDRNVATMEVLARLLGAWEHACATRGLDVVLVRASEWQSAILRGIINRASKRAQRKRAARMWVKATFGLDCGEDESDAIALAVWGLRTARARGLGIG